MSNVIFVADTCLKIRNNEKEAITIGKRVVEPGKEIVSFVGFQVLDVHMGGLVYKGFVTLNPADSNDKALIDFLMKRPEYEKKIFVQRNSLPQKTYENGSIIRGTEPVVQTQTVDVKAELDAQQKKFKRYLELRQLYFKTDGELKANVDKDNESTAAELSEFENLKKELNLQ